MLALTDCIDSERASVCSLDQAQRLLITLQKFADRVQIEALHQVHTPTQLISEQLPRHFGAYTDGPTQAQWLAGLDAAWDFTMASPITEGEGPPPSLRVALTNVRRA